LWIHKRGGRLAPFEADKISRSLFAATETLREPDAFMARELADGVVHFLTAEAAGCLPTTADVADMVIKVVRELGQPALAQAYAEFGRRRRATPDSQRQPPTAPGATSPADIDVASLVRSVRAPERLHRALSGACLRSFALREVFTRDLVAAQNDGLLTLMGLEAPLELANWAPGPLPVGGVLVEAIADLRDAVGCSVALDGPEYALARHSPANETGASGFVRELAIGLRATGLWACINLNAPPPSWADELAEGPLFARQHPPADVVDRWADLLAQCCLNLDTTGQRVRIDWHLGDEDFKPGRAQRLLRLARRAGEGAELTFAFDRPRRSVALAEGLDRDHPATLLTIGLHLPRLAELPGLRIDATLFLQKLGSLARLALSAAVQKRDFLRRHGRPSLHRGFLVDRARLVVVPVGLGAVAKTLTGCGLSTDKAARDLGRQIILRLSDVLRHDGQACRLESCLDSAADLVLGEGTGEQTAAGLTPWEMTAPASAQLKTAGAWHGAAGLGTAAVLTAADRSFTDEQVVELLRYAWEQTDVVRVQFIRDQPARESANALWAETPSVSIG
jgi:hypothetical protein